MYKLTIGILIGGALATGTMHLIGPTYQHVGRGYVYSHVPYPDCAAGLVLTVDAPERDEVDALTVTCAAPPVKPFRAADPQVALGEWKIELQTPPCDSAHNIQVIYPKESGYPTTIECDAMPVSTR